MEIFTIRNLNFAYPEQAKNAISDLTLSVQPGEFLVLCGPSGCGKSTLLRQLKTVLAPHGRRSGEILFDGRNLDEIDQREQSEKIGFVQQSPENQIVTDKVWHELAFGLESLGYDTPTIRRRVAEMASFFGIQEWFYKPVTELSGGQKAAPEPRVCDGASAESADSRRADEPARPHCRVGLPCHPRQDQPRTWHDDPSDRTPLWKKRSALPRAWPSWTKARLLCTGTPADVGAELKVQRQCHVPRHARRHAHLGGDGFQSGLPHLRLRRPELAARLCENA